MAKKKRRSRSAKRKKPTAKLPSPKSAPNTQPYEKKYSERGLWSKIKSYARTAGRTLVEKVLILYYGLKCPKTPNKARAIIIGALGYFISPLDLIPDLIPVIGYSDDMLAVSAALGVVLATLCKEDIAQGKQKAREIFG